MTKNKRSVWYLGLGLSLVLVTSMAAADSRNHEPKSLPEQRVISSDKPATLFRPAKLGKPIDTTGGGTRGLGAAATTRNGQDRQQTQSETRFISEQIEVSPAKHKSD